MNDIDKCPTCGTTRIKFDPPIALTAAEACGAPKPGTYTANPLGGFPICELPRGHNGRHTFFVEYADEWP